MTKPQRIRDPLHDLIQFSNIEFEQFLWELIQAPEFQRLRRIKQLGFSELVYPGATHSRFAHSIGVFHTARKLLGSIKTQLDKFDENLAEIALTAALVHDLGHGPFSHAFEEAVKALDKDRAARTEKESRKTKKHELWTTDIISQNTEISNLMHNYKPDLSKKISALLSQEIPDNIYASLVSSQFDADRLDYVRRDRMMSGAQHGGFDFSWLLANLDVAEIPITTDDQDVTMVPSLVVGEKATQAAESYVLGLFHLYFAVYFHKATRFAESILTATLRRLGQLISDDEVARTGLNTDNPLVRFIRDRDLDSYLRLDDYVIWGSISEMKTSRDGSLEALSSRLLNRKLYKAIDISSSFEENATKIARFQSALAMAKSEDSFEENEIFEDRAKRTPYKRIGNESNGGLSKIWIKGSDGYPHDIREFSEVVNSLQEKIVFRVYVRDDGAQQKVEKLMRGI